MTMWKKSIITGMPKTAKPLPLQPSAAPSTPKWVGSCSGSRFHSSSPSKMGSRVMAEVISQYFLFFMVILLSIR